MEKSVYCTVRWSNHSNNVNRFLSVNYAEEKYTDVALACDGHVLKAHKMILAGCSPYFENLFSMYSVSNLCIAVEGIAYPILQLVLEFMYSGEIRVKHSELENLVKAGVQLKVKGLDAIKLNDLTRGAERTTVIARPTDGNSNQKVVKVSRPVPPSTPKSPQKPTDPVQPLNVKTPPKRMEPLHVQQERLKPIQKPLSFYGQKPPATSTPLSKPIQEPIKPPQEHSESPDSPSKQKIPVVAENLRSDKEDQSPVSSPSKPGTLASESKRKVGEWLDSLERTVKKQQSKEPVPEPQPRQTRKRATKPRAARSVKEAKVPRAVKRLRGSNGVEGDVAPQEPLPTEQDPEVEPDASPIPEKALSPLKETPVKNAPEPQEAVPSGEQEEAPVDPVVRLKEEALSAMDSEEHNQDEESDSPPPVTKKNTPEKAEVTTTTRSRTIKKPARMIDAEFEFEPEVVHTKKRRPRRMDDAESENPGDYAASSPTKRRKAGAFLLFSSEYRTKLMEESPGETRKEISKRLGILWQQLDQATKDKYHDPDFKPKKDK